jgi:hypothetical protein
MLSLTGMPNQKIYRLSTGLHRQLNVVLPPTAGAAETYGCWMQSFDGGHLGYLQPGWLVAL